MRQSTLMAGPERRGRLTVAVEPLAGLEREWSVLAEISPTRSFFTGYTFNRVWWDSFRRQREERIYVVRDQQREAVAILPLYRERRRTRLGRVQYLALLGTGDRANPDFLDILVRPGLEAAAGAALLGSLRAQADWDFAEFNELDPAGVLPRLLGDWSARTGGELREEVRCTCPYIPLPDDFELFLKSCNPHFRQQLRRYRRVIERDLAPQWKKVGVDLGIPEGLRILADLHQERMEGTDRGGNFRNPEYAAFHRALAEGAAQSGELSLWILFLEGRPAASHYGFLSGGVYYGYQMGFAEKYARYSPGHYVTGIVLEKLIAARAREMNFLRGTDRWKFRWTDQVRTTRRFVLLSPGWRGRWAFTAVSLSQSPALALRFLIGRESFDEMRRAWLDIRESWPGK